MSTPKRFFIHRQRTLTSSAAAGSFAPSPLMLQFGSLALHSGEALSANMQLKQHGSLGFVAQTEEPRHMRIPALCVIGTHAYVSSRMEQSLSSVNMTTVTKESGR